MQHRSSRTRVLLLCSLAALAPLAAAPALAQGGPSAQPTAQMQAVLDALKSLEARPVGTLDVPEARMQASPADAAATVQRERRISPFPEAKVKTRDIAIPASTGNLAARVYFPEGEGPFPVVVYYHGGGWVIADLDTYDATPRALSLGAEAIVVSVEYRHAPEHEFPAAHDDAWAAYVWTVENIHTLNGDADRIAVAGESAGGNLAANVAIRAKETQSKQPVRQLLVYPVAGDDMSTPSYQENAEAVPLGRSDMAWFVDKAFASKDQTADPRIDLVGRDDLAGLPPATVILAQIDPLRSEGQAYADRLKQAGVPVEVRVFDGVTHEFFGMAKVVDEAKQAMELASADLRKSFAAD